MSVTYYNTQGDIETVTKKKDDTGLSEEDSCCNLQPTVRKVIERERRIKVQIPNVDFKFCEYAKQNEEIYLSKIETIGELIESGEQFRDDNLSEVEIHYDATDNPHEDSEREINNSTEVMVKSMGPTEHRDEGCFRKVGMSEERSSKSRYKNEENNCSKDTDCRDTKNKCLGVSKINEGKAIESFEGGTKPRVMPTRPDESCIEEEAENPFKTHDRISKYPAENQSCRMDLSVNDNSFIIDTELQYKRDRLTVEEVKLGNQ